MRVRLLYIFGIGNGGNGRDAETETVCAGLYTKYAGRCGPTALLSGEGEDLRVRKKCGDIPLNNVAQASDVQVTTNAQNQRLDAGRGVGVYMVLHGGGEDAIFLELEQIVNVLVDAIPTEQRRAIEKIALIQCYSASAKHKEGWDGRRASDINEEAPFVIRFLAALREKQINPIVAGWDEFISAAPSQPKQPILAPTDQDPNRILEQALPVRYKPPGAGTNVQWNTANSEAELTPIAGRKIVRTGHNYQTVTDSHRNKKKHYYQIDSEGRVKVDRPGWSDNPRILG